MSEYLLIAPTWQKGCIEEMVILEETRVVLKYTFSNSLDNIRTAIYARTGHKINLEKALWKQNNRLSISVKNLMNFHNVNYSMTTEITDNVRFVAVNMRIGDRWFITGYDENNGELLNWHLSDLRRLSKINKLLMYVIDQFI
ncbi:hypothetical protein R84B8_00817 [Treponema sp. R8-4-B8]